MKSTMNTVTTENFESKKIQILNSISIHGNIIHPNQWATCLHIFKFENESAEDLVSSFLINAYQQQLSHAAKHFEK